MDREKELRQQIAKLKAELEEVVSAKGQIEYWYCSGCQEVKPVSEFRKKKNTLHCYCKPCDVRETTKYHKTPEARERQRIAGKKRRENPEHMVKRRCQEAISWRVQEGTFPAAKSKACSICGKPATDYHHHNGYDLQRWDDVIPVCRKCHRQIHSQQITASE